MQIEDVPEDTLPPIPLGLRLSETDEARVTKAFKDQFNSGKQRDKNRKKRDQKKR
jgi:hypothetical protein